MDDVYWLGFIEKYPALVKHSKNRSAALAAYRFRDAEVDALKQKLEFLQEDLRRSDRREKAYMKTLVGLQELGDMMKKNEGDRDEQAKKTNSKSAKSEQRDIQQRRSGNQNC